MTYTDAAQMIQRHEGYRPAVYNCSAGYPTCGWGHALHIDSHVPLGASLAFFDSDMRAVIDQFRGLGTGLVGVQRAVILDMLFCLGLTRFKRFKKFIAAIRARDFKTAGVEILDSKWHRDLLQYKRSGVELRTEELSRMISGG